MEKEFSREFRQGLADILEMCMENKTDELVTTSDNRYLRKIIHDMTKGCLLTRNEFQAIIRILELAVDRMLWEAENEQADRKEK